MPGREDNDTCAEVGKIPEARASGIGERMGGRAVSLAWDGASLCLLSWYHYEQCPLSLYKCLGVIISDIFILLVGDGTHHRILNIRATG